MASLIIIAAEELLPMTEDRARFKSLEEVEHYTQEAIEKAKTLVSDPDHATGIFNAVVTASGSVMAMVRWNLEVDADPPVEVARFRSCLVPY